MIHATIVAAAVLLPLLVPEALPELRGGGNGLVIFFDPPPPPPLPLPLGSGLGNASARPRAAASKAAPEPPANPERLVAPIAPAPTPEPETPPISGAEAQGGSPTGSVYGVPEGMEGGELGGEIGGVPGGVVGGVIGGTGTGPVPVRDYDRAPRPLRVTRPTYPQDAFVKKVEGTVMVEIVIDSTGQVVRARVVQSIPMLDRAALDCVREWLFEPAIKQGRPVATLARAPVTFRIL